MVKNGIFSIRFTPGSTLMRSVTFRAERGVSEFGVNGGRSGKTHIQHRKLDLLLVKLFIFTFQPLTDSVRPLTEP